MAVLVALPNFGEEAAEGLVAEWYYPDGASVDAGEVVCRVESAFVAFEVEAEGPGLLHHRLPAGSFERAGAVLGLILDRDENVPDEPTVDEGPPVGLASPPGAPESAPFPLWDAEPEPADFEDRLVQAVVVPFPGKFAGTSPRSAGPAFEKPIAFDPALFGEAERDRTPALSAPGGSIPGLPLWEPDEPGTPTSPPEPFDEAERRFGRIRQEVAATAQVLTVTVSVDLAEAERMRAAFEREWRAFGNAPLLEDVVFRAIAMAIEESAFAGKTGAMLVATKESDLAFAVREPVSCTFREAVAARVGNGGEAFESASWLLVSLAALGVSSATSRLDAGRAMSFALGSGDATRLASLTMTYDSSRWSEGSAARLLSRVRDILDVPYAMLT